MIKLNRKAQSTLEYAVLIAIVAAACAAMTTYVQRAVRANMKTLERQINVEPD
ncbi:MAG: class III signal peptide-containing protein [Candidatus Omnitrophica bacterium]|nr:class III signal peptide-containing protein [Candidatus Omnitrophota bacterium]